MANWSELLPDLLAVVSKRLTLIEDFVAFRGVCTSWRAASRKEILDKSWPTAPLLMLAEKEGSRDHREFYSLSKGKIWRAVSLPQAKGKKCMESRGWLITSGGGGEMSLLHPLSGAQIELPHQHTFPWYEDYPRMCPFFYVRKAVLSADPSESDDFVLMVVHYGGKYLGFWRARDKSWTTIKKRIGNFSDVNYYQGKFYGISHGGHIWACDFTVPGPRVEAQLLFCIDPRLIQFRISYLVESAGELLIVARDGAYAMDDEGCYGATSFRVLQLDLINCQCKEITSLGYRSIFLGHNASFSVDAISFPGVIKPNCIYFTDDCIESYENSEKGGGKDMGIYNLEDGRIERFDDIESFSSTCPPVWVALSF